MKPLNSGGSKRSSSSGFAPAGFADSSGRAPFVEFRFKSFSDCICVSLAFENFNRFPASGRDRRMFSKIHREKDHAPMEFPVEFLNGRPKSALYGRHTRKARSSSDGVEADEGISQSVFWSAVHGDDIHRATMGQAEGNLLLSQTERGELPLINDLVRRQA